MVSVEEKTSTAARRFRCQGMEMYIMAVSQSNMDGKALRPINIMAGDDTESVVLLKLGLWKSETNSAAGTQTRVF